jgi:hypothetical protein
MLVPRFDRLAFCSVPGERTFGGLAGFLAKDDSQIPL